MEQPAQQPRRLCMLQERVFLDDDATVTTNSTLTCDDDWKLPKIAAKPVMKVRRDKRWISSSYYNEISSDDQSNEAGRSTSDWNDEVLVMTESDNKSRQGTAKAKRNTHTQAEQEKD